MPVGKSRTMKIRVFLTSATTLLLSACFLVPQSPAPESEAPVAQAEPQETPPPATTAPAPAPRTAAPAAPSQVALQPGHPDRYVVKRGDTLWDISGLFLRDPWFWPEIWYVNPQIANPHLIYPGDVLTLVYIDGQPRLQLERGTAGRLSPRIREQPIESAIPTIPYEVIAAFLANHTVVPREDIDTLPYILTSRGGHLIAGAGTELYVRGTEGELGSRYNVIHVGDPLIDPDDNTVVGYEGILVGKGRIERGGDPATMLLTQTDREALNGDRLLREEASEIPLTFFPRAPEQEVDGQIISVIDGLSLIGAYQVVVLNRGAQHGLEAGHVLTVHQAGKTVRDRYGPGAFGERVKLPDEPAGTVMVFQTHDRLSYALVMRAISEMHVLDHVRNPT